MSLHGLLEVLKLMHSQDGVLTLMPLISLPSIAVGYRGEKSQI